MGCYYISIAKPGMKGEGMKFSSLAEADLAFHQGVMDMPAKIHVRLPKFRRLKTDEGTGKFGELIETTYGRVLFNMMLPNGMDFYNYPLKGSDLAAVISDCYSRLGRKATIDLLDSMNQLGFRESTKSGLSFGTDDLITPDSKHDYIVVTEKEVMKRRRLMTRNGDSTRKVSNGSRLRTHSRKHYQRHVGCDGV